MLARVKRHSTRKAILKIPKARIPAEIPRNHARNLQILALESEEIPTER
jgi:hypothetical protein